MSDPRFPIGGFERPSGLSEAERDVAISEIAKLPSALEDAVTGLSEVQLVTPYRAGGWTISQVVHHLVDSHINSLCRFKLGLTEESPVIRPYDEDSWVRTPDAVTSVDDAIALLREIHKRWVSLLRSMTDEDFERSIVHPDSGTWTLAQLLALYAWHGKHHLAHITETGKAKGW
jgi:uncharacterized damage-inducible protein DinB